MPDYGQPLEFGTFLTPGNAPASDPVEHAVLCEQLGYDLVTFQDHPYQPRFLDTWTLLTWVAARTDRIRVSGNVLNLRLNGAPHHLWTVELIDRAGRAVRSAVWPAAQPELAVDVQGLPAGAYLLRGTEGNMQRWARMVQVAR